ncbi:MAG: hypothetical protein KDE59_07900 [Anaerolineales bacterium]|nr:hypothetical protein [Anaerolineales bacterium]
MTDDETLKPREIEILRLMSEGRTNREIGEHLHVSVHTVRWYAKQIYGKLRVGGREEASQRAAELALISGNEYPAVLKHNLPTQLTPFVGRDIELAELHAVIAKPETRLLTILAPGGMGKTRLAQELGARYIARPTAQFPDGVFFVPLQSIMTLEQVVTQIIASIRFQIELNNRDPKEQLISFLADKQMLLLIDNWEHVLDAASLVTDILRAAPHVKILATSREKLRLHGEVVYVLQGMHFPEWGTPEDALDYDAVKLLAQAAQRVKLDWAVTAQNLEHITRICRLTQGMPLGIVLAAGWLDVFPLARIVAEIQNNVDFLESDLRDTPERQRSIRAVFEWTWDRLRPDEREVFKRLAVFRGGCTPQAAETIAGANARILQSLVNRALLLRDSNGRYDIHELLRQYGEAQLRQSEADYRTSYEGHCRYFSERNEAIVVNIFLKATEGIREAEAELENLHSAWRWAVETRAHDTLLQSMSHFSFINYFLGRYADGIFALEPAIKAAEPRAENRDLAAGLLANQAFLSSYHPISEHSLAQALDLFAQLNLTHSSLPMLFAQFMLAMALRYVAPERSIIVFKAFVDAVQRDEFEQVKSVKVYLALTVWEIALVYKTVLADGQSARPYATSAERLFNELQSPLGIAVVTYLLADIDYDEGDYAWARARIQNSIQIFRGMEESYNFAMALSLAAQISLHDDDLDQARVYCVEALQRIRHYGFTRAMGILLVVIVKWLLAKGELRRAAELAAFIQHHKVDDREFAIYLGQVSALLRTELSDTELQEANTAGQFLAFDEVMIDVIAELEE